MLISGLFGIDEAEPRSDTVQPVDMEDSDLANVPDLKPWRQLKEVTNKVPSVM